MAGTNVAAIAGLLKRTFRKTFTEMVRNETGGMKRIATEKGKGKNYEWKVQHGRNESVGPYKEEETIQDPGNQNVVDAVIPWSLNRVVVRVTGLARAISRGEGAFAEALAFEMRWALPNFKDELNRQVLSKTLVTSASGAEGLMSIGHIVDDGSINAALTSYAGLNRNLTYWAPYILDNAGTPRALTIQIMQSVTTEMDSPERNADIDAIWAPRINFNQYGNLMQDQRQYVNTTTLDGGFLSLPFEGIPMVIIKGLPAGDLYFMDEGEWVNPVLLDFETEEKDVDMDANRFVIKTYQQIVCRAPARQARITDLATS